MRVDEPWHDNAITGVECFRTGYVPDSADSLNRRSADQKVGFDWSGMIFTETDQCRVPDDLVVGRHFLLLEMVGRFSLA